MGLLVCFVFCWGTLMMCEKRLCSNVQLKLSIHDLALDEKREARISLSVDLLI